jgi:mRNA-degrading endonuclease RelE of RelBE toxin-antitoxin system
LTDPAHSGYTVKLSQSAEDDLKRLDRAAVKQISQKLLWLAANVQEVKHEALKG